MIYNRIVAYKPKGINDKLSSDGIHCIFSDL